ncbi:MAG: phosphoribosylformylglycinamidine synthase [Gammaproteobacteria bacterium]|nr:phosphoribosylformylglycinamidine synthase [Gammaproteobacteria bacterium]
MNFTQLIGQPQLSAFRLRRLLEALRRHVPSLREVEVWSLYFVDAGPETPATALRELLGPGADTLPDADGRLYVVPRLGTTSPWSSKATDIARVCGFDSVRRIETGRALLLHGVATLPPDALIDLHDPMTESVIALETGLARLFEAPPPRPLRRIALGAHPEQALEQANRELGLALSPSEIAYLAEYFAGVGREPTDAELMMFAQLNSEHCRHKIFNAAFVIDGVRQARSPFDLIRASTAASPQGVLSAYRDNAAVVEGPVAGRWFCDGDGVWRMHQEPVHLLMKVETHNHPTGISPHPGAATGAGGEIRDEAATGRGGKPKAGLCGFAVSDLRLPGLPQPWEADTAERAPQMASALRIMLEAPIGAAAYNNEFGRPNLCGYFRTFQMRLPDGGRRGYDKPVMLAGGLGNIRTGHVAKRELPVGAALVVLGGPAMLIGLGGGAASSMATGTSSAELDFASVQRANPELERRCQEVIDACWALGEDNPILSVHDVGAGGLSNALPELVHADGRGGHIRLRDIDSADRSLSPMQIWCNEAQERYVLALAETGLPRLAAICRRERCPHVVVGRATAEPRLTVADREPPLPVDVPLPVLFGKPPRLTREVRRREADLPAPDLQSISLAEAIDRVLQLPCVAGKGFLITIGDRTVGGLTVRDQMVGPWQVPVADCAVTASGYTAVTGEAMAVGERPPLALIDAPASGRIAVGEAITNIAAARIARLADVRLSANWMAAAGSGDEDARLYDTVRAVGAELCPALGVAIPVGKDSLSMRSTWRAADGRTHTQTAPLTLNVTAFAPVVDVRATLTPQLITDPGTRLLLIDLGSGRNRLGGSALAQVFGARQGRLGGAVPDVDQPAALRAAFELVQQVNAQAQVLAYHDRSDGGLLVTLCEMAFAGRCGLQLDLDALGEPLSALFAEELGMVLQLRADHAAALCARARAAGLAVHLIGAPLAEPLLRIRSARAPVYEAPLHDLLALWARTSHRLAALRDDPDCAAEEYAALADRGDPGLQLHLTFALDDPPAILSRRPEVAILREQGVNGQAEMAYAFDAAGFTAVDLHMTDLLEGRRRLEQFAGVVACGGFSYGDVLGAGQGWAKSVRCNAAVREQFAAFLADTGRFTLGVCNGCQMLAALAELIPGVADWPRFVRNRSEQFEARWSQVEILESRSLFFSGMAGSRLPVAVAHGEGRAQFARAGQLQRLLAGAQVAMRFVTSRGEVAERYPANPNGSPGGVTALCNADGRVTVMMPHPERTVSGVTGSWWPRRWDRCTPWIQLFRNARARIG